MPADDSPIVAARRQRLKGWIDQHFAGEQARFLAHLPEATRVNQGLLSGLLGGGKSFGEKQADKLEKLYGMPEGYLVKALDEVRPLKAASQSQSQSLTLSHETLHRATVYLEGQFRKRRREFVPSQHVPLLTGVYDFLLRTPAATTVVLNKKFGRMVGEANERERAAGSTKQNDRSSHRGRAAPAKAAARRQR